MEIYNSKLKCDLVKLCLERKLKISGNKVDLCKRLIDFDSKQNVIHTVDFNFLNEMCFDLRNVTLQFLSDDDLQNLTFVCKDFNQMVNDYLNIKYKKLFPDNIDSQYRIKFAFNNSRYITQSKAIGYYRISKKDLENLSCCFVANPHFRCAAEMKLYLFADIIPLVIKKFKSITKLMEYNKKLKDRPKRVSPFEKRAKMLADSLAKRGLELRNDSKLCNKYIQGQSDFSIEYIVQRMCQMKYLHEYMDFKKFEKMAQDDYDYDDDYDISFIDFVESYALKTLPGGKYPLVFPWEN